MSMRVVENYRVEKLIAAQPADLIAVPPHADDTDPAMTLVKAEIIHDANVTLDGTDFWTLTIEDLASVALCTPISSEATSYTKGVPSEIVLLTTLDQRVLAAASLQLAVTKAASGMDIAATVRLTFERSRI